jgi:enoyl-CoA hydratase/carnithine racemase/NAD(P)H-dependent flavin oxidoreductase YrpB (nitropropane dioxygenase family)
MHTPICDRLGCDIAVFAFSHCRDVVSAVSWAGGFGVLGASTYSPAQLEIELAWLDENAGGRPYGVDILVPAVYDRDAETSPDELEAMIPKEHRDFQDQILAAAGVPELPGDERARLRRDLAAGRGAMTPEGARHLMAIAVEHPAVKMVVSALGAPPADVVEQLRSRDVVIGALCGRARHAERHIAAGVEVVIAQGTEAGGHTGDIATMVLVPEVVQAVGDRATVLAAGGIFHGSQVAAALAMGAQGVWCGTIWLGTRESELDDFERGVLAATGSDGTVRRKARTAKTVRMIRSELSEAWERPGAPPCLPTPLQGVLYNQAHARVVRARRPDLYSFPAGRPVGRGRDGRDDRARRDVPAPGGVRRGRRAPSEAGGGMMPEIRRSASGKVLVTIDDGLMTITLNRPQARNAIDRDLSYEVCAAVDELDDRDDLKVGILTGAGGTFCSGMDLKAFVRGEVTRVEGRGLLGITLTPPRKPMIAAVEGYAVAGGFEAVLACDLLVAARDAQFGLPEARRGLAAAAGGLIRLPRLIPPRIAMELALTGDLIGAGQLERYGLVNRLVEPGKALGQGEVLARKVIANAPLSVAASKRMITEQRDWPVDESFERQEAITGGLLQSADAREGATAFAQKRPAVWTGA